MGRLAAGVVMALLLVAWLATGVGAQQAPGAPTISTVTAGDGQLAVTWTAPTNNGGSAVTSYDLRYITTSADETIDSNWTVKNGVWASGSLAYTLKGLLGGIGYDVQLRAANTVGKGSWSATAAGTPTTGTPTIASVHTGGSALTVVWNAPAGVSETAITAYDLRYIATSADETVDSNWTVEDNAWTPGDGGGWAAAGEGRLLYVLTGLTNATGYDLQVRAVTTTDGNWSATSTGTPAAHGSNRSAASTLTLGIPLGGEIDTALNVDYFKLELPSAKELIFYTSGTLDTMGELVDSNLTRIGFNDDHSGDNSGRNFLVKAKVSAGTYYMKVASYGQATGSYVLHSRSWDDTTGSSDAQTIELDGKADGLISGYNDVDYFEFSLSQTTDVTIRMTGDIRDSIGTLKNSDETELASNETGFLFPDERHFVIRKQLAAGDYLIELKPRHNHNTTTSDQNPYVLYLDSVAEPGSTSTTAASLEIDDVTGGNIDSSTDVDYFKLVLDKSTNMLIRAVSHDVELDATVLGSDATTVVQAGVYKETFSRSDKVHGFTIRHTFPVGTYYVKLTRSDGNSQGAYTIQAEDLANHPNSSAWNTLVALCTNTDTSIGDPLYGCQWNLDNAGLYSGTKGEDINVKEVWSTNKGEGVNVAVVDEDFDAAHRDLRENADESLSYSYVSTGLLERGYQHGTRVAGIIAARDNHRGVIGVAPRATIYGYNPLRVSLISNLSSALKRNFDETAISNNSWGHIASSGFRTVGSIYETAVKDGVTDGFHDKGILYVFAAGNGHSRKRANSNLSEISNHYAVTAVCSVNKKGTRSAYSEMGANLWLCAPSNDTVNSTPPEIITTSPYDAYTIYFGGTSAATPTVSGVAALIRSAHPDLTWRDVKLILAGSARKNDSGNSGWDAGALQYGSTTDRYHFNHEYGFGVVDAKAATDLADIWTPLPDFVSIASEEQTYSGADGNIPNKTTTGETTVSKTLTIGSEIEFTEFVELNVNITTQRVRDLQIELTSPSNEKAVISPHCAVSVCTPAHSFTGGFRFGSAKHLGENPAGEWTLAITDKNTSGADSTLNSWNLKVYGHRHTPEAPTVNQTAPVDNGKITVFWSEPGDVGASAVSAYKVRHIRNDAEDKTDDDNWTVISNAGTARTRGYTISGLTDGVAYDAQVSAVNSKGDGLWSPSITATPATNVNASPYFTEGSSTQRSVAENTATGQSVGAAVGAVDTDSDTLTYSLSGTDAAHFTIVASSGQLQTKSALNFEVQPSYTATVSVTDSKNGSNAPDTTEDATVTVTIGVGNVEEAGVVALTATNLSVSTVVTASLTDPDGGVTGTTWAWKRSADKTTWAAITGATSSSYTITSADRGSYLQATASYTDARGPGKTASAITQNAVSSPVLAASSITQNTATLTLTGYTENWWLKRVTPADPANTCKAKNKTYTENLNSLSPSTTYTYTAHANDTCNDNTTLASKTFNTPGQSSQPSTPSQPSQPSQPPPPPPPPPPAQPPPPPADVFSDIANAGVHQAAVRTLAAEGVMEDTGCGNGRLCPNEPLQRWELAVWLIKIRDETAPPAIRGSSRFEDVRRRSWWAPYVERLADLRITLGCSKTPALFCPEDGVTRSQMASFLVRAFKLPAGEQPAGFQDIEGRFNAADINALYAAGITKGCRAKTLMYCPQRKTTRGQMASFLSRARSL